MTVDGRRFAAVILAAGLSSRMGSFKPLMTLVGQSVLARCIGTFRTAGLAEIIVVTGHRAFEVQAEVERLGVSAIHNPAYEQGMFSSVRTAASGLSGVDAFFLLPVDIALVRSATIASLARAYDGRVAYPVFKGERGHPPLIPARLIPEVLRHDGDAGMKGLLERHPFLDVPVWDQGILLDADTADDFAVLVDRAAKLSIGTRDEIAALAGSMPERGMAHGRAVAAVAVRLGEGLNRHGGTLDLDLVHNAALVHDLAKGVPGHEARGGQLLAEWGLHGLAGIVAAHRDVPAPDSGVLTEKEVVCLADKLVRGSQRISVRERFGEKLALYRHDAQACAAIRGRMSNALDLLDLVERTCGQGMEEILDGVLP